MKLQYGKDYILAKRGGYYEGKITLQHHGNMVVTKNRILINVIQTNDIAADISSTHPDEYKDIIPLDASFQGLKDRLSNVSVAAKDFKDSLDKSREAFRKLRDFPAGLKMLEEAAARAESLEEFEVMASVMGETNPKSLNIPLSQVQSYKFSFFGPWVKLIMRSGAELKLIVFGVKGEVKKFLLNR